MYRPRVSGNDERSPSIGSFVPNSGQSSTSTLDGHDRRNCNTGLPLRAGILNGWGCGKGLAGVAHNSALGLSAPDIALALRRICRWQIPGKVTLKPGKCNSIIVSSVSELLAYICFAPASPQRWVPGTFFRIRLWSTSPLLPRAIGDDGHQRSHSRIP